MDGPTTPTRHLDLDGLQQLLWTFAQHRVLVAAARTGILRRLSEGSATADEVASELDLDPLATGKIVRATHALGLLLADGDRYRVVDDLRHGFLPGDGDLHPFLEHSQAMYRGWGEHLEGWIRGEGWPSRAATAEGARAFGEAMRAFGTHTARAAAVAIDLKRARRMLDVGGGFGHVSRVFLERWPDLEAAVLDTPAVVEIARAENRGRPHAERLRFLPGNYHETDFGQHWDVVLLANVLHQETAAGAAELIRRAAAALGTDGRVVVIDFAIDDERRNHLLGCLFAVNMRSFGDTWTEDDIRGWMRDAGLRRVERTDLSDLRWVLTGRR